MSNLSKTMNNSHNVNAFALIEEINQMISLMQALSLTGNHEIWRGGQVALTNAINNQLSVENHCNLGQAVEHFRKCSRASFSYSSIYMVGQMMSYHVRDLNVSGVILRRQNGEGEMQHWSVELDGYTPSFEEFILEAFKVILNRTRYLGTNTVTRTRYKDNSWPSVNSSQIIVATIANDVPRISSEKYTAVEHTKRELSMYEMEALMSTTINGGFTRSSPIRWTA